MIRGLLGTRFRPGDIVRVRDYVEIAKTLDSKGAIAGLPFMDEMRPYCGRTFQVHRHIDKINDMRNKTGLRRMRHTYTLTEQRCSGANHDSCQAGCQLLWKEDWLAEVNDSAPTMTRVDDIAVTSRTSGIRAAGPDSDRTYSCQMTSLWEASEPLDRHDIRQDLRPLWNGNIGVCALLVAQLTRLFNIFQQLRGGASYPDMPPSHALPATPSSGLQLKPGESVVVRRKSEIASTLSNSRNKGLWFDRDLIRFCGQPATVERAAERVINEATGKMVIMKTPCIVLRETSATGEFLRCCSQHEHIFWREAWLQRQQVGAK